MDALNPFQFNVRGRRRARDPGLGRGCVEAGDRLGHHFDDLAFIDDNDQVVGNQ